MFLGYYSGHAVSLVLGTMYPVYRSFKSLQPGTPSEQWLPYWILFAIFSSLEFFLDFVFAAWMPFYYELKVALVLYLQPVYFDGAAKLYSKYLEPFLVQQSPFIDQQAALLYERAKNLNAEDVQKMIDYVQSKGKTLSEKGVKAAMKERPEKPASPPPEEPAEVVEKEPAEEKKDQ